MSFLKPSEKNWLFLMPIIEPHVSGEPLNQGDLLRGVKLFLTGKADALTGGESLAYQAD